MGRPAKNNAEYFPHYTSMRNHRKIKALRNKFGSVQGYAFWVMMLEWLTEQDGIEWEYSELECEMFAAELGVSVTEIRDMVDFCIRIELLFKTDSGFIYSESLNEYLKAVFEKRQRARDKSQTRKRREDGRFCDSNSASGGVSVTEIPQSKVKESKVEKSKEKEIKEEGKTLASDEAPTPENETIAFIEKIESNASSSLAAKEKKASHTGGAPAKIKAHLFKDSQYFNLESFKAKFAGAEFEAVDLEYYYNAVYNWSEGDGRTKIDWIATARGFMNRDKKDGKLATNRPKVIPITHQSQMSSRLDLANRVSQSFQYDENGKMIS